MSKPSSIKGQSTYYWLIVLGPLVPLLLAIGCLVIDVRYLASQHELLEQRLQHSRLLSQLNSTLENQVQSWNNYLLYSDQVDELSLWQAFRQKEAKTFDLGQQLLVTVDQQDANMQVRYIIYSLEVLRIAYQEARNIFLQDDKTYVDADDHVKGIEETPTLLISNLMESISEDAISRSLSIQQKAWQATLLISVILVAVTLVFTVLSSGLVRRWFRRQHQDQDRIDWLLDHDYLTRLHNRRSFIRHMDQHLASDKSFYMLHIAVPDLSETAKIHGHSIVENLFGEIAERLIKQTSIDTICARGVGTDFLVLLPGDETVEDAAQLLHQVLSAPYNVQGFRHELTVFIGVSSSQTDGNSALDLLQSANIATVQTQQHGSPVRHYHVELAQDICCKQERVKELQEAIAANQVNLLYQPKVCLKTQQVVGFEALSRLDSCSEAMCSPAVFIPLAEDTGLIKPLGYLVLLKAIKQLAQWHHQGWRHLTMAINLSSQQLNDEKLPYYIRQLCQRHNVPTAAIELELTESDLIQDKLPALEYLRNFGFKLSIDDFGTGYSNLGYMITLQPQQVKIDRDFVSGIEQDISKQSVVKALHTLALGMDIELVAEGIETQQQLNLLLAMGVSVGQGYLFSRPVKASVAEALIASELAQAV